MKQSFNNFILLKIKVMTQIKLSEFERSELLKYHKKENNRKIADRIKTILLLDEGYSYFLISKVLFLDDQTIKNHEQIYCRSGLNELLSFRYKGSSSKLSSSAEFELKEHIASNHYHDSKALIEYVKGKYSIEYSRTGIIDLLHRLGFEYKKPKIIPGKANADEQIEYLETYLRPVLDAAGESSPLYFADGVHPTHNVQPQYGWILKGLNKEIRTNSGRQRVNINGALCFHSLDIIYREDESINRDSTLNLLKQIRKAHEPSIPVKIVLDNAKYNRAQEVTVYAAENNIKLMHLPPYSPNLNLIERLWRFFKSKVCTKYYEKFKFFKQAVFNFFDDVGKYKNELKTLITENFQIIGI